MNITDFKASLDYLFKAQITAFVWGHAGIGKSTVVKQYAEEKGYKFFPFYLGTQSDLGDILGLASFVKDKNGSEIATTFATPLWLKDTIEYCIANPTSGAIIFLDEFNRARRDILNGMFSLALDKTFHTLKLPVNCHIVAAGNPPTDEYDVTDINETALMARFAHIKLEPTFNEWATYARGANFEPTLISFLQEQPELLEDAKSNFTLPIKVDRRSYERVHRLFNVGTPPALLEQLMCGIIGAERLVAYKLHLTKTDKPLTGQEVLSGARIDAIKKWSKSDDVKSSLLSITCDNLFEDIKTACTLFTTLGDKVPPTMVDGVYEEAYNSGKGLDMAQRKELMNFLMIVPKEVSYPLLHKMLKLETPLIKAFMMDSNYEDKIIRIAKEAKGMKIT